MRQVVRVLLLTFAFAVPWEYSLDIGEPVGNIARVAGLVLLAAAVAWVAVAQGPVTIRVNAAERMGRLDPIYAYFGYDEPNFTYTGNGRKLIAELAALRAGSHG